MKKNLIYFILTTFLVSPVWADRESFVKAHEILKSSDSSNKYQEAISVISDGLRKNPDSIELLQLRFNIYTSIRDLKNSYNDIVKLVQLRPDSSSYNFWMCVTQEALGYPKKSYIKCYEKVISLSAEELGKKKESDYGYICTLLLSENPQGKVLAEKFLQTLTNSTVDQYLRNTLENFDRKNFLPVSKTHSSQ